MPKRNNIKRVESPDLQGEDSYVVIRTVEWGVSKQLKPRMRVAEDHVNRKQKLLDRASEALDEASDDQKEAAQAAVEAAQIALDEAESKLIAITEDLIKKNLIEWNWVDDDGNPLDSPSQNGNVLDRLSSDEVEFLGLAIGGQLEKNGSKTSTT